MKIEEYLVAGFFFLFILFTILKQLRYRRIKNLVSKIDWFQIIPIWTFFAPNPGTNDYYLLYRTKDATGTVSAFKSVESFRKNTLFLVNRKKRIGKLINDISNFITQEFANGTLNDENIRLSYPYIILLNIVQTLVKSRGEVSVQFAILVRKGFFLYEEDSLLLCSDFHKITTN